MPEAKAGYAAPAARVPRTIFEHAHEDGSPEFPPIMNVAHGSVLAYAHIPDNWNALDKLILWVLGLGGSETLIVNITINIGTCNEVYTTHTQTVNNINIVLVANEYECVDLTTIFATVLANLAARDIIRVQLTYVSGDNPNRIVGIELQET